MHSLTVAGTPTPAAAVSVAVLGVAVVASVAIEVLHSTHRPTRRVERAKQQPTRGLWWGLKSRKTWHSGRCR